jgi:ABC-type Mn2+/Zn2+ transport system ATPase subunit
MENRGGGSSADALEQFSDRAHARQVTMLMKRVTAVQTGARAIGGLQGGVVRRVCNARVCEGLR